MFSSLRARLWLTYTLVSGVTLCLASLGFLIYLLRSPLLYRQVAQRLRTAEEVVYSRLETLPGLPRDNLANAVQRAETTYSVRIWIVSSAGQVVAGGRPNDPQFPSGLQLDSAHPDVVRTARAASGKVWLYTARPLDNGDFLVVAAQRPAIPLISILRDDLVAPVIRVALIALLLAFLLAFFTSRWIAAPLQRMAAAAREVAAGKYQPIPLEGPAEERELAAAFNEMTRKVQAGQQSQREFVANVSHELKTPLTSIQGFAQAILDGTASTPEALRQAAGVIHAEAGRMYRLVLDLLALARLQAGTADLEHTPVDMAALLDALRQKFDLQARQAGIEFRVEAGSLPPLVGDGDRLMQVFTNLVDNAIKFTPSGGRVSVSAQQADGMVAISVADTGAGMSPEVQQRIFERFYQADKSRHSGSSRGFGLGLAIAREIVNAHGGSISVTSAEGQGSTFVVRLPAVAGKKSTPEMAKA